MSFEIVTKKVKTAAYAIESRVMMSRHNSRHCRGRVRVKFRLRQGNVVNRSY